MDSPVNASRVVRRQTGRRHFRRVARLSRNVGSSKAVAKPLPNIETNTAVQLVFIARLWRNLTISLSVMSTFVQYHGHKPAVLK